MDEQKQIDCALEQNKNLNEQEVVLCREEDVKEIVAEKKKKASLMENFLAEIEKEESFEKKVRCGLECMRLALSGLEGVPHFKDFWEMRRICITFFKENLAPKVRSQLWNAYVELSLESKRLKEILDEKSAFAAEQIELAIQGLERDLENIALFIDQQKGEVSFEESFVMKDKNAIYGEAQKNVTFLSTLASRINALRKEVVKTEMRIRFKNKFLSRLGVCGDRVFPLRKEWISKISTLFSEDVERFVSTHFQTGEFETLPLHTLREEVKLLQGVSKELTLNTPVFTETRLKLSACWDQLKVKEKDLKKETAQKRQLFKQNFDLVKEKIAPFAQECETALTNEECQAKATELLHFMRTLELGKEEIIALKEEIFKARRIPLNREKYAEEERQKQNLERELLKKEEILSCKQALQELLNPSLEIDLNVLNEKKEALQKRFEELSLAKAERQVVDRQFKQLKDLLHEKKTKALLMLSDENLKAVFELRVVLEERKARRQEIKNQLESYRKLLGGSSLDFEKAISYREIIEAEKASLGKMQASIQEIEERIEEIEG